MDREQEILLLENQQALLEAAQIMLQFIAASAMGQAQLQRHETYQAIQRQRLATQERLKKLYEKPSKPPKNFGAD